MLLRGVLVSPLAEAEPGRSPCAMPLPLAGEAADRLVRVVGRSVMMNRG